MRFLITGASGFIGHGLTMRLADAYGRQSLQLIASPRPRSDEERSRLTSLLSCGFDVLLTDLLADNLEALSFRDFDACFHLAAFTETETSSPLVRVNDIGTGRLLDCLRQRLRGTKIIYTSSVTVTDCSQSTGLPRIEYARTKLAGEHLVKEAAERSGAAWTVVRIPTVIGPGYRSGGLFAMLEQGLRRNQLKTRLAWPGRISLVYLDDTVDALVALAAKGVADNSICSLSAEDPPTLDHLIDEVAGVLGVKRQRIQLPRWCWDLVGIVSHLSWQLVLPSELWIAVWRVSNVLTDTMLLDGAPLNELLGLRHLPLRSAVQRTYLQGGVRDLEQASQK